MECAMNRARSRNVVATILAVVGAVLVFFGLVHTIGGLPLGLQAIRNGAINVPSIEDAGFGYHFIREHVHWLPRVMPAIGLLIFVPLLLVRGSFTIE